MSHETGKHDALNVILATPHGSARCELARHHAEDVEANGPDEHKAIALLVLIDSYLGARELEQAYVPFTKLVRWWDRHPEHFDAEAETMFFRVFMPVIDGLMEFPQIPAEYVDRAIEDMATRFSLAGNGMYLVALVRFLWANLRGTEDVEARFDEWINTPLDEHSPCEACIPAAQGAHLIEIDRKEAGLRLLEKSLSMEHDCPAGHVQALIALVTAHAEAKNPELSRQYALRLIACLNEGPHRIVADRMIATLVRFLIRARHEDRAIALLRQHSHVLTTPAASPFERWHLATILASAMRIYLSRHPEKRHMHIGASPTLEELVNSLRSESFRLARAFDARHGTKELLRRSREAWESDQFEIPISLTLTRAAAVAPIESEAAATSSMSDGITAVDDYAASDDHTQADDQYIDVMNQLLTQAQRAHAEGRVNAAAASLFRAGDWAERLGDHDTALIHYRSSLELARENEQAPTEFHNTVLAVIRVESLSGSLLLARDECIAHSAELTLCAEDDRATRKRVREAYLNLQIAYAKIQVADGQVQQARATLIAAGSQAAEHQLLRKSAKAFAELGAVCRDHTDELEAAQWAFESAFEAYSMIGAAHSRARVGSELIRVLHQLGKDEAARDLAIKISRSTKAVTNTKDS